MKEELRVLVEVDGVPVWANNAGTYIQFLSNLDICNDGSGPDHGDEHHVPKTAYYNNGKFLNADTDFYIVVPPQVRRLVAPLVMGCKARLTRLDTNATHPAVCGEIGPKDKTGEASYILAKAINPRVSHNHGDLRKRYLYELWPGVPATVGNRKYKLEGKG